MHRIFYLMILSLLTIVPLNDIYMKEKCLIPINIFLIIYHAYKIDKLYLFILFIHKQFIG